MMDYCEFFKMSGCRLDNLELEEKKITAAHNGLMFHLMRSPCGYDDGGWHNLRAFLINRVEQLSGYALVVTSSLDSDCPDYKICDRKTYLKDRYGVDWPYGQKGQ